MKKSMACLVKPGVQGFTLVEVMITVAIIGILAATALPMYQKYVYKAEAAVVVENVAAIKERLALLSEETGQALTTGLSLETVCDSSGRHLEYSSSAKSNPQVTGTVSGIATSQLFNKDFGIGINVFTMPEKSFGAKSGLYRITLYLPSSDPCATKASSPQLVAAEAAYKAALAAFPQPTPAGWPQSHPAELAAYSAATKARNAAKVALNNQVQKSQQAARQVMLMAAYMLESGAVETRFNGTSKNQPMMNAKLDIGVDRITIFFSL